jgi:hypothetical protein
MNANSAELYKAALPGTTAEKAAARAQFGLGTAAEKAVQTSATDITAGALMAVGAFGLGSAITLPSGSDLNAISQPGTYSYLNGTAPLNLPMVGAGYLEVIGLVGYPHQRWKRIYQNRTFERAANKVNPTTSPADWNPWVEVFHTGNILGTVSQSGGVPTGAIIERGSNANGEYVRFADGTQICWVGLVVADAAGFKTASFPASFINTNMAFSGGSNGSTSTNALTVKFAAVNSSTYQFGCIQSASPGGFVAAAVSIFIIGRWY